MGFCKTNCPVLFSKRNSPTVRDLTELRFSLCCWELASTWLPEHQGVRGITYLHCCVLQVQLIWQLGHRSSRICEGSNLQALQHFWGACPDQLLVCQVLSKKTPEKCRGFHLRNPPICTKHLHHWIMEWSFIAESQVILHHLTSLEGRWDDIWNIWRLLMQPKFTHPLG